MKSVLLATVEAMRPDVANVRGGGLGVCVGGGSKDAPLGAGLYKPPEPGRALYKGELDDVEPYATTTLIANPVRQPGGATGGGVFRPIPSGYDQGRSANTGTWSVARSSLHRRRRRRRCVTSAPACTPLCLPLAEAVPLLAETPGAAEGCEAFHPANNPNAEYGGGGGGPGTCRTLPLITCRGLTPPLHVRAARTGCMCSGHILQARAVHTPCTSNTCSGHGQYVLRACAVRTCRR